MRLVRAALLRRRSLLAQEARQEPRLPECEISALDSAGRVTPCAPFVCPRISGILTRSRRAEDCPPDLVGGGGSIVKEFLNICRRSVVSLLCDRGSPIPCR
ncbi:hypothetical protein SBV1_260047 [Verrucomicrobia bacterium]|nr:hypothetical protein SBV1_260047 [Verrucomicrobiota bacterium]